jgi:hypothetical protein
MVMRGHGGEKIEDVKTEERTENKEKEKNNRRGGKEKDRMKRKTKRKDVRFEVFTAVTMKNGVFWDVTPCGSYKTDVSEEPSAFAACVGC